MLALFTRANICGSSLADREPRCVHQLDLIDLTGVSVRARQNTNRLREGANLAARDFVTVREPFVNTEFSNSPWTGVIVRTDLAPRD